MVKCLLCGRDFKNDSGLTAHVRMSHPTASIIDGQEIEARMATIEHDIKFLRELIVETVNDEAAALVNKPSPEILPCLMIMFHLINQHGFKAKEIVSAMPASIQKAYKAIQIERMELE